MNTCLAARGCTESRMDVLEARSRGWVMCALGSPQITPAGDTFCLCFPVLNSLTHPVHQTLSFPLLPKTPVDLSAVTQAGHSQQCSLLFPVCKWSSHRIAKITLNNHLWQKWRPWAMAPSAKAQSISSKTSYGLFKLRKTRWNAASKPCGCNDCHSSIRSKGSQRESAKDWSFFPLAELGQLLCQLKLWEVTLASMGWRNTWKSVWLWTLGAGSNGWSCYTCCEQSPGSARRGEQALLEISRSICTAKHAHSIKTLVFQPSVFHLEMDTIVLPCSVPSN